MTATKETPKYLSCAETAKLVRKVLAKAYPTTKFSVRSHVYSMGASIRIHWTDGPTTRMVDAIVGGFNGARFDGTIDLKFDVDHWLLPDGTTAIAYSPGTEGSHGTHPRIDNGKPHPAAILVSFGADYIFTERTLSDETAILAKAMEMAELFDGSTVTEWRIMSAINFLAGETVEDAFQKVLENRDRDA